MNINKYTEKAQEADRRRAAARRREGTPEITPEHLLLALVEQREGIVPEILRKMNADPAARRRGGARRAARSCRSAHGGSQPGLSPRLRQVTDRGARPKPSG